MKLKGISVSPGISFGKALLYSPFSRNILPSFCKENETEEMLQRYQHAKKQAEIELQEIIVFLQSDPTRNGIFVAQKEILYDQEVEKMMVKAIIHEKKTTEYAVSEVFSEIVTMMSASKSEVFSARSADFQDVENRLLRILLGEKEVNLRQLDEPVIIVTHNLLPSDTATLDKKNVQGIITEVGSVTSHSAIFARAYGIPAISGVGNCLQKLAIGTNIILDAIEGLAYVNAPPEMVEKMQKKQKLYALECQQNVQNINKKLFTKDNIHIEIGINISETKSEIQKKSYDFVGLLRTEFVYMQNNQMPSENEQFEAYKKIVENAKGKEVTIRTLDVGGDKTIPYIPQEKEENPFLGKRAVRLSLANKALFISQMKSILRASVFGKVNMMIPMVTNVEDVRKTKKLFEQAKNELRQEGVAFDNETKFGIMIETPAIVEVLQDIMVEIDFASVGTNDLCQYLCAADRMNVSVAGYYQLFSPSLLRVLKRIAFYFAMSKKPLSVCGELAGIEVGACFLVGIGIRKLSMSAGRIGSIKTKISQYTTQELAEIANKMLECSTQEQVKEISRVFYN